MKSVEGTTCGWSRVGANASGIAKSCPEEARGRLKAVVGRVGLTGCVWRSDLKEALGGVAHYGNWLSVAELERSMFEPGAVQGVVPAFVIHQFVEGLEVLPMEVERDLERVAKVSPGVARAIAASMTDEELEDAVKHRMLSRKRLQWSVSVGVVNGFYDEQIRRMGTSSAAVLAQELGGEARALLERCVAICKEVADMYPADLSPAGGTAEGSAFAMARRTANHIEGRIKGLMGPVESER